ncbi:M48 family metalloprotease [Egicoccus sp. AB-alg6-2]|uniref:M48 family metalloprotease n=1 Tax=Egicoccus sp. AB-alg6-2 TaxID=3242692 RepID=UPI00359CBAC1
MGEMFKSAKTFVLLAAMSGLLLLIGAMFDGGGGGFLTIMMIVAIGMNFFGYFYSDKLAIKMARAQPMDEARYPDVYAIVRDLARRAGQPMPRLYISPSPQLNAFATGRNPSHAAVCINEGLYRALDRDELEGVIGHELQHVYNRDILIGSVAAMIGTAISYLALMLRWLPIMGNSNDRGGMNPIAAIAASIIAPIVAMVIQASITRSRESLADHTGAELTGKPLALASALAKLERGANDPRMHRAGATKAETNPAMQHLFIAAPFGGRAAMKMFSTHPPIPERIAALEEQARRMGQLGPGPRR